MKAASGLAVRRAKAEYDAQSLPLLSTKVSKPPGDTAVGVLAEQGCVGRLLAQAEHRSAPGHAGVVGVGLPRPSGEEESPAALRRRQHGWAFDQAVLHS